MTPGDPSSTLDYYESHAERFFADTVEVDLAALRARFLAHLPPKARILDAGCGSGRDARAFLGEGHIVSACDASPALARRASAYTGLAVQVRRVQDIAWRNDFDGIWACASLLHVPAAELPAVLQRLTSALHARGVLYASFKYGRGERVHEGRHFTDLDEAGLAALLQEAGGLTELETWITADQRPERAHERWLNTLLRVTV